MTNKIKGIASTLERKKSENSKQTGRNQITAILLFALAIFLFLLILVPSENLWNFLQNIFWGLFGKCAVLWPILLLYISITTAKEKPFNSIKYKIWLSISFIVLFCSVIYVFKVNSLPDEKNYFRQLGNLYSLGISHDGGGLISGVLGILFAKLFGVVGARIILFILTVVDLMFLTGMTLFQLFHTVEKPVKGVKKVHRIYRENNLPKRKNRFVNIDIPLSNKNSSKNLSSTPDPKGKKSKSKTCLQEKLEDITDDSVVAATNAFNKKISERTNNALDIEFPTPPTILTESDGYIFPPISLLDPTDQVNEADVTKELQTNGQMLVDTLKSFGVQTKIVNICRGPAVTRYELQPATGVKISKITSLADDIALNLAASGVRIEAPIPGKAAVGIEIPNKIISIVKMRELIASTKFMSAKSKLSVVIGKDIAGDIQISDLAKMPHLLIAGSTGSGKSVCINSFLISLLYKSSPDDVRLLMIDPKVVELGVYNGIPHLLVPVVTDPKKAAGALNWAVTEMLNRYKLFAERNVRDLKSYNKLIRSLAASQEKHNKDEDLTIMPQIVIVIDELADLMMAAPNEVEDAICRLAQMARAAGMHLVIATQRPSVDVITGIIKANIPSRIALAVSSQVDSRTILDNSGAEKLLGRGDMLFSPIGSHKPMRVQGCYVTDREIEAVVDFVKNASCSEYDEHIIDEIERNAALEPSKGSSSSDESENDPMLEEAIKCIVEAGQASTSLLQRRLRVGYARAGRLIDQMEQMGIIGPYEGSKPRQVCITRKDWLERNFMNQDD